MAKEVVYRGVKTVHRHVVYSREEADAMGLIVLDDWRDGERGDWVQTDDGFVVKVLKTGVLRQGSKWVRTAHGTFLSTSKLTTEKRASRYTFTGRKASREFKMSARVRAWATAVVHGQPAMKAYMDFFQSKSTRWAEQRIMFLLRQPEVIDHMKRELEPILTKLGVNQEMVIKGYLDIFKEGDSDNVRLKALTELAYLTGVKDEKPDPNAVSGFIGVTEVFNSLQPGANAGALPVPAGDDESPILKDLEVWNES